MDLGGLSTETIETAARYLAEKAAGGAATAAGSKLFDWLKSKLLGSSDQELLQRLSANPESKGTIRSLDGALLSYLEKHPDHVGEIRDLLTAATAARSVQTVIGSNNTTIQAGHGNVISVHRKD
jgi:hypothetical protein